MSSEYMAAADDVMEEVIRTIQARAEYVEEAGNTRLARGLRVFATMMRKELAEEAQTKVDHGTT